MYKVVAVLLLASLVSADQMIQDSYSQFETENPPQNLPQLDLPKTHFGELLHPHGCHHTAIDPDADCIPGKAHVDYPDFVHVPNNHFDCAAQLFPGLYADTQFRCQVFHICDLERTKSSFLCPKGTILDQRYFVCVWWFNFNCADAPLYYFLNEGFYNTSIPPPVAPVPAPVPVRSHPHVTIPSPFRAHPTPAQALPIPPTAPYQPLTTPPTTPHQPLTTPPSTLEHPVPPQIPQLHSPPQPHTQFSPQRVHHTAGHKAYVGAAPAKGVRVPAQPQPIYPQPAYPPAYQPATPFVPETRPANYF